MFAEDDYVTLSALQHYVFCPRQCALIYTEQMWAENALTVFGKLEHERVDTAPDSVRGGIRTARAVQLVSHQWGIRGVADVVEYHLDGSERNVVPVEYKHGKPAGHGADPIQLCAQALCLEEMHQCRIPRGFLYYHRIRRREPVELGDELREKTAKAIRETRQLLQSGELPPACLQPSCKACSLVDVCLPSPEGGVVSRFNDQEFSAALAESASTS